MNRRTLIKVAALFGVRQVANAGRVAMAAPAIPSDTGKGPIVLYCDLAVDPTREQEMLHHFHHDFKPVAERFDGYIDLKMLKVRKVVQGGPPPPTAVNYRFQLTYESEEKRQVWIASEVHRKNWPLVENTVIDKGYLTLLTDSV
jgi:hypothetical protein